MKREQLESVVSAMRGLLCVVEGAQHISVTHREQALGGGIRVAIAAEADEDVHAMAGALGVVAHLSKQGNASALLADIVLGDVLLLISGPWHLRKDVELDAAKVSAAVAQAQAAIGGVS